MADRYREPSRLVPFGFDGALANGTLFVVREGGRIEPMTGQRDRGQPHGRRALRVVVPARTPRSGCRAIAFSHAPMPFHRDLPPAQWPPGDYLRHVGIYVYLDDALPQLTDTPPCTLERIEKPEQLRALWPGSPIHVMRWHQSPPRGVDTPADAARVPALSGEMKQ